LARLVTNKKFTNDLQLHKITQLITNQVLQDSHANFRWSVNSCYDERE